MYKYDIEKVTKEIQEIRRKYNEQRKREQLSKDNERLLQQSWFIERELSSWDVQSD